jgi:diguanylate cyclase (GGDEF)-like protein/putative nucleotidyltransferase with HDIG domain
MGIVEVLTLYLPSACALALAGLAVLQRGRIRALRTRISDAARSDPLTGLLNRRSFDELLELEVERARRTGRPLSVLFGDIDNFARVNEEQGHEAADAALELVARDLGKWKRRIDRAARIGGDEFALLLPETDEHGAHILAERLRRATHRSFGDAPVPLTICFGVASHPCHGGDSATLMRSAERAMLAAKQFGRDRSVVYSADVPTMLGVAGAPGDLQLATVIALAEALDIRDTGTAKHSHMVGHYAELMAIELELESAHVERVRLAGVLHDVGKIGVSDAVLSKPGPLSADEWVEMKTHPEIAARLLSRPEFDDVRGWILAHHERPDGGGYPFGLGREQIPLEARILAVADAFEAMTADRVYRAAIGHAAARAELEAGAGRQFDAEVVEAFLRAVDRAAASMEPAPGRTPRAAAS